MRLLHGRWMIRVVRNDRKGRRVNGRSVKLNPVRKEFSNGVKVESEKLSLNDYLSPSPKSSPIEGEDRMVRSEERKKRFFQR